MKDSSRLIYVEKGLLAPVIVKTMGYLLFPVLALTAFLVVVAAFYTREWWLLLIAVLSTSLGLLPIFGLNSVELWISGSKLIYKENPFDLFPMKPIPICNILDVEVVPRTYAYGRTFFHIVIMLTDISEIFFSFTMSKNKAEEVAQIIREELNANRM